LRRDKDLRPKLVKKLTLENPGEILMSSLEEFRHEKDHFFADNPHSPLTHEQKEHFNGLDYFPENPSLKLELTLKESTDKEEITIQTSTGDIQTYQRVGTFRFEVDGQETGLTVFANQHGYFLPFVDSLAGSETYPAGRYTEPEQLPNGKFLLDFNFAYNPYCAYNEQWSCPLTPFENRLKVPIRAGEKVYKIGKIPA
jgi:uncharacterized protein (DUF1684 family)